MEEPALTASAMPQEVPWSGQALPGKDLTYFYLAWGRMVILFLRQGL